MLGAGHTDHGYAWVILAAIFMFNVIVAIQFAAVGVFLVEFRQYFNTTWSTVALIGSTTVTVGSFLAFPLSFLVKILGMRVMAFVGTTLVTGGYILAASFPTITMQFICYGFLPSIGLSIQLLVSFVALQKYFDKKRKLASGLFTSGISVGILGWPVITEALIQAYGWRGAMILLAGCQMNGFVFGALLRPIGTVRREGDGTGRLGGAVPLTLHCKKDHWTVRWVPFAAFCLGVVLIYAGHQLTHAYTPVRAEGLGMTKYQGAFLVSLIGITGLPARPLVGMLGTHPLVNKFSALLFGGAAVLGGMLNLAIPAITTYTSYALVTAAFGITAAGYVGIQAAIIVDILGITHSEIGTGSFIFSTALSYLIMHSLTGWLIDSTGSTATPFYLFGICQVLGGLLVLLIPLSKNLLRKRHPSTYVEQYEMEEAVIAQPE